VNVLEKSANDRVEGDLSAKNWQKRQPKMNGRNQAIGTLPPATAEFAGNGNCLPPNPWLRSPTIRRPSVRLPDQIAIACTPRAARGCVPGTRGTRSWNAVLALDRWNKGLGGDSFINSFSDFACDDVSDKPPVAFEESQFVGEYTFQKNAYAEVP
jgi:hypothetical protein